MKCSEEFSRLNFQPRDYVDSRGKTQKCYEMTRDGFMITVMGFLGEEAMRVKEDYIAAFNFLEKTLLQVLLQKTLRQDPEWQKPRQELKAGWIYFTDSMQKYWEYSVKWGRDHNAPSSYEIQGVKGAIIRFTKAIYKACFNLKCKDIPPGFRDNLSGDELRFLEKVEVVVVDFIYACMEKCVEYHAIYENVKEALVGIVRRKGGIRDRTDLLPAKAQKALPAPKKPRKKKLTLIEELSL